MDAVQVSQPRSVWTTRRRLPSHIAYGVLAALAAAFLWTLFHAIPIGTEARDYIFFRGYLAQAGSWTDLFYPVGSNRRLVSMVGFALAHDTCGFGADCLNALQIVLLLLCLAAGTLHLHQVLRRPILVCLCMGAWCLSLPVFSAGFWQATQHDKLACLFSLTALALGLDCIRRDGSFRVVAAANLALLGLFVLALNSKEIAFFLPGAAAAQAVFLAPAPGWRGRLRAGRVYALPVAYACAYIGIYMARLNGVWHGHVMGGDIGENIAFYWLSLLGRQHSSGLVAGVALAALASFATAAWFRRPVAGHGALAYLMAVFAANLALVLRAQYPDNFYLLIAAWAFFGSVGAAVRVLESASPWLRTPGLGAAAALALVFAHKRTADLSGWGSGELLREARALNDGYRMLRPLCGDAMHGGLKFVFTQPPLGQFFFFRGGGGGKDPLLGAFVCQDGSLPPMSYSYDGVATPDHAGQLVVRWTPGLSILAK